MHRLRVGRRGFTSAKLLYINSGSVFAFSLCEGEKRRRRGVHAPNMRKTFGHVRVPDFAKRPGCTAERDDTSAALAQLYAMESLCTTNKYVYPRNMRYETKVGGRRRGGIFLISMAMVCEGGAAASGAVHGTPRDTFTSTKSNTDIYIGISREKLHATHRNYNVGISRLIDYRRRRRHGREGGRGQVAGWSKTLNYKSRFVRLSRLAR